MNNSHTLKGRLSLFIWIVIIAALVSAPSILPVFRLNLLGRYLSLAIVALGVDLIWGFTGLLSLGQGIFFTLGGYCIAMCLYCIILYCIVFVFVLYCIICIVLYIFIEFN